MKNAIITAMAMLVALEASALAAHDQGWKELLGEERSAAQSEFSGAWNLATCVPPKGQDGNEDVVVLNVTAGLKDGVFGLMTEALYDAGGQRAIPIPDDQRGFFTLIGVIQDRQEDPPRSMFIFEKKGDQDMTITLKINRRIAGLMMPKPASEGAQVPRSYVLGQRGAAGGMGLLADRAQKVCHALRAGGSEGILSDWIDGE